jgi:hypothetical protein
MPVFNWLLNRTQDRLKAELNERLERHKSELNKELEQYKSELKAANEADLERLKYQLRKTSDLDQKRVEACSNLSMLIHKTYYKIRYLDQFAITHSIASFDPNDLLELKSYENEFVEWLGNYRLWVEADIVHRVVDFKFLLGHMYAHSQRIKVASDQEAIDRSEEQWRTVGRIVQRQIDELIVRLGNAINDT